LFSLWIGRHLCRAGVRPSYPRAATTKRVFDRPDK
jgi:hypothetical protein